MSFIAVLCSKSRGKDIWVDVLSDEEMRLLICILSPASITRLVAVLSNKARRYHEIGFSIPSLGIVLRKKTSAMISA